jgi:hypothetical protein
MAQDGGEPEGGRHDEKDAHDKNEGVQEGAEGRNGR